MHAEENTTHLLALQSIIDNDDDDDDDDDEGDSNITNISDNRCFDRQAQILKKFISVQKVRAIINILMVVKKAIH